MQNNIVVYTHSINGTVFYVGCGGKYRPYNKTSRNEKWLSFVDNNNGIYDINIISKHRLVSIAKAKEIKLIKKFNPSCNIRDKPFINIPVRGLTVTFDSYISKKIGIIIGNSHSVAWCKHVLESSSKGKQEVKFNYKTGEIAGSMTFNVSNDMYNKIKQSARSNNIGLREWCRIAILNEMTKYYSHDLT